MNDGLRSFLFDVYPGDPFEFIEAEYGLKGFAVVVKLFQKIFGERGYYCEWTNDVALLFSRRIGEGGNVVSEIVTSAVSRGIFDGEMFKQHSILTSEDIQMKYFQAVKRWKKVELIKQYLLLDPTIYLKNVSIIDKNVDINIENVYTPKTRKVKERKKDDDGGEHPNLADPHAFYEYLFSTKLNQGQRFDFDCLLRDFGEDEVTDLMEEMKSRNIKHPLSYIRKVLGKRSIESMGDSNE